MMLRTTVCALLLAAASVTADDGQAGPAEGEKTVMFTLQSLNTGGRVNLKKIFGGEDAPKAVLVTFFASWCKPCKKELPHLQETYASLKDKGFEILAVFSEPDKAGWAKDWWEEQELTFPLVSDEYGIVKKRYGIAEYPTSFLVGSDGTVVKRFCGYSDDIAAAMDAAITGLVAE